MVANLEYPLSSFSPTLIPKPFSFSKKYDFTPSTIPTSASKKNKKAVPNCPYLNTANGERPAKPMPLTIVYILATKILIK